MTRTGPAATEIIDALDSFYCYNITAALWADAVINRLEGLATFLLGDELAEVVGRARAAPPPEAAATSAPEPACTTVPISAQQLSSGSGVPAGRARGVSPRAATQPVSTDSSHFSPAVPGERVSLAPAVMVSALAVTTARASPSAGSAGKPRRPWRDLARMVP
jgi:hypothetical protein